MATTSQAVLVSYASEDAAAAQRIADALRAAGVEGWFDQSELRGGDAWDQSIPRAVAMEFEGEALVLCLFPRDISIPPNDC